MVKISSNNCCPTKEFFVNSFNEVSKVICCTSTQKKCYSPGGDSLLDLIGH